MFSSIKRLLGTANDNFLSPFWWEDAIPSDVVAEIFKGANVNAKESEFGSTPLMYAAENSNNPEVIKTLVKLGADVNAKDNHGSTPLMGAVRNKNPEIIKTLVGLGAKIDAMDENHFTPLRHAILNGDIEVIKTLVELGADVNAKNKDDFTPLEHSINSISDNKIEIIRTLVELGADVNAKNDNFTPLRHAILNGDIEVIKVLVELGADVNANTNTNKKRSMISSLVSLVTCSYDSFPLENAVSAVSSNKIEVIKTLVELGADVNAKGEFGRTALMRAAGYNSNPEVVKILLELGADVNAKDESGKTALDYAKENNNSEIINCLLS